MPEQWPQVCRVKITFKSVPIKWFVSTHLFKTPPKWQKNDLVSRGHGQARPSWELAWTMNWVDRLRTSADKRMWSGPRAVVMRTGRRADDVKDVY